MNKKKNIFVLVFMMLIMITCVAVKSQSIMAAEEDERLSLSIVDYNSNEITSAKYGYTQQYGTFDVLIRVDYDVYQHTTVKLNASVSDNSVLEYDSDNSYGNTVFDADNQYLGSTHLCFRIKKAGYSKVTVRIGDVSKAFDVYVNPEEYVDVLSVRQTGYRTAYLKWSKCTAATGYVIMRAKAGSSKFTVVKYVAGRDKVAAGVDAAWNKKYTYRVVPYVMAGGKKLFSSSYGATMDFATTNYATSITSVMKNGSSSLKVKWKPITGAVKYIVYRSTSENGTYKAVKTVKAGKNTSFSQKVSKGVQYYYKVSVVYKECTSTKSSSVCGMVPKKSSAKAVTQTRMKMYPAMGQYSGNWSTPDWTYYHTKGEKFYNVQINGSSMKIYALNSSSLRVSSVKTVKLGSFDSFGGFFQGTDGYFYVAVGFNNYKESSTKTVVKVYKYNSRWKRVKTCNIKGNATNMFKGIYVPFDAGNCRMTQSGSTLYLEMGRTMFAIDGVNHQSNIAFKINTKTMKYKSAQDSYSSHSFNQFVKFNNGDLFILNHGDAYPRAVALTLVNNYGKSNETNITKSVFNIMGGIGDNYTGLTVGGMEVGVNNVVTCGTSVPQGRKVAGIKGNSYSYAKNVYVTTTNRKTGKTVFRWLTNYNPKTSKTEISETRMVKLSDNYFAVMYSTITAGGTERMHYVVIDNSGKKVYSKTYKSVKFYAGSQPILYKGNIVWTEAWYASDYVTSVVRTYRIPAIY